MSDAKYRVVFSGEVNPGAEVDKVKTALAARFNMNGAQVEKLFGGGKTIVKKNADLETCQKTQAAFQLAGALCTIEEEVAPIEIPLKTENQNAVEADSSSSEANHSPPERFPCSGCGRPFPADELIQIEGMRICGGCKPSFVQRIKEGAEISVSALSGQFGSVEKALNGQVDFSISAILKEAWRLVRGSKLIIVGGIVCMYVAIFGVSMLTGIAVAMLMPVMAGSSTSMIIGVGLQFVIQLLMMAIMYPFMAGLFMVGIRRSAGLPVSFSMIFGYFNRTLPLLILNVIMTILVIIGFFLLVLPGIYLTVSYILAMPLLVEKNLSPWQALETSRKAVGKKWFKVFGLFFLLWIIVVLSMIPLGLGLIWTAPLGFIAVGTLYRNMFGVEAAG